MNRLLPAGMCALLALWPAAAQTSAKPKLVVAIIVDQFRYDYLTRFGSQYNGGLATLLKKGAVFTNARYDQFPTVTAVGHSIFMSGANPAESGIVGNTWYSREEHRLVTAVCDSEAEVVGAPQPPKTPDCTDASPASPRRFLVDTVGDELKMANAKAKVVGISLKPRAAILPSGHLADGAFWFDESGVFASSSFYAKELPPWAVEFNKTRPADQYAGKEWMGIKYSSGKELYHAIPASPWGNELVEYFAEAAIEGENLGGRGVTDLLTVSFSANDYVGHRVGPDAPEVRDMALRTDHVLDRLFHFLSARRLGPESVLIVFSADHGVAPILPEKNDPDRRMPGKRMPSGEISKAVQEALTARFGAGDWLVNKAVEYVLYLNLELIQQKKLDPAEVNRVAAEALAAKPYIYRVYTREQLASGVTTDRVARAMSNGFFSRRSGDLFVLLDPYWLPYSTGTTHGTPFNYDSHVPVIFMGGGVRQGFYNQNISVTDIAPTLATILGIQMPSGAEGRALAEIIP